MEAISLSMSMANNKIDVPQKKYCPDCHDEFALEDELESCPHDDTLLTVVTPSDSLIGQVVGGHYEIIEAIGSGGFGVVYKAHHQQIDRTVAIKIPYASLANDSDKLKRFHREAQALSNIIHPAVATAFDFGFLSSGQPFLVMEYLNGISLSELLMREGPMPAKRAIPLLVQMCDGLAAAHAKGVIHRDIKPSNVFIVKTEQGEAVKLLDFGVAKLIGTDVHQGNLTETGQTAGTPDYMSPEQCLGHQVDGRTDIYNAGLVMYEMLTGEGVVRSRSNYEAMSRQLEHMPPSFSQCVPSLKIDPRFEEIAFRAMEKSVEDRYQSPQEMRDALLEALESTRLRPDSRWKKLSRSFKRKLKTAQTQILRQSTAVWLLACTVALLGAALALAIALVPMQQSHNAPPQRNQTTSLHDAWQSVETDGVSFKQTGKFLQAAQALESALEKAKQIGDESDEYSQSLSELADVYQHLGNPADLERVKKLQAARERKDYWGQWGTEEGNSRDIIKYSADLTEDPSNKDIARKLVIALNHQAALKCSKGQYAGITDYMDRAEKIAARYLGKTDIEYAKALGTRAFYNFQTGNVKAAESLWKQSYDMRVAAVGADDPSVARVCLNLGRLYEQAGNFSQAELWTKQAAVIYSKQKNGLHSENYADAANALGVLYMQLGDYRNCRNVLNTALDIRRQIHGATHADTERTICNLAELDLALGQPQTAINELEPALAVFEKVLGPDALEVGQTCQDLGIAYEKLHEYSKAQDYYLRAFDIAKTKDARNQLTITAFQSLCRIYKAQGKLQDAIKLTAEVQHMQVNHGNENR